MTDLNGNAIPKVDYTKTPHPSGVKALSLKDAPSLIEALLPVQKLSIDVYKERMAGPAAILSKIGSYWKGRKPLVLNRACVLASLLPVTTNPIEDLEVFELLMGMDDVSLSKRFGLLKPADIVRSAAVQDIRKYFSISAEGDVSLPVSSPFDVEDYAYTKTVKGQEVKVTPTIRWHESLSDDEKHEINAKALARDAYKDIATNADRPDEVGSNLSTHIWPRVNKHLGTSAANYPELIEQLGVMRFGHRPTVGDTFSGSGQIPFAAAQLGCDVFASDLNPVACMLTWGAFNVIGASAERRLATAQEQLELIAKVKEDIDRMGVESDGAGWRGKAYLYCLEVTCPSSGWRVPVLPTLVVSKGRSACVRLIPIPSAKRYDIQVINDASAVEMRAAAKGTYQSGDLVHHVDGREHRTSISSIRGDYVETVDGQRVTRNKLRLWEQFDVAFRSDDIYNERLYAIQWVKELPEGDSSRAQTEFRSVTSADLEREKQVERYVRESLENWQMNGWVPDTRIEPGDKTDEPIRTRGWTYWHHLFNPRQLLSHAFVSRYKGAYEALGFANALNWNSKMSRWEPSRTGEVKDTFYNQSINPLFAYGCRGFIYQMNMLKPVDKHLETNNPHLELSCEGASQVSQMVDIFVTDPPYGDAVKYEEILEFFIAWFRKNTPPQFAQWTWDSRRELAIKGEDHDFRLNMVSAYKRMAECMPDNGIQILMFTHQDGNIWADMANIVWASGLRVTAAWYLVTETDSALREGSYVKGTILLVLRKRLGSKRTNQTDLAYELEDEVAEQIKRLIGMNASVTSDSMRAKDGNLFEDADLQMAGYAAALKVLTKYSIIDGKDMAQEALRPRVAGQKTLVESLIEFATDTANKMLVPLGLDESVWHELEPAERFYLKMLEQESHGLNKLDNYQNFAKAFAVRNFSVVMASENANKAALKSAVEFGRAEMNQSSELFQTPTRAVLYAIMDLQAEKDLDTVLNGLEQNLKLGAFYSSRDMLIAIARYIGKKVESMRPDEASAARVLADGIENQRL